MEVPRFELHEKLPHEAITITSFSDNCIKGSATLTEPRIAFFSIPYDDGWKIYDNGEHVEKMKVNIGFMGIFLEPGEHEIELRYRLPGLYEGAIISLISILLLAYCYRREKILANNKNWRV